MADGISENNGLCCPDHGWKFDPTGACIEQSFEERVRPEGGFMEKWGYRVEEVAGLIFAYLGPQPTSALPVWSPLVWEDVVRAGAITEPPISESWNPRQTAQAICGLTADCHLKNTRL